MLRVYDKRGEMPVLCRYRKFPHVETKLSQRCLYAVLHSQLCRFAVRCTRIEYFEVAAAKLMADMCLHLYNRERLDNKLFSFSKFFFRKSPIPIQNLFSLEARRLFWHQVQLNIWDRIDREDFNFS